MLWFGIFGVIVIGLWRREKGIGLIGLWWLGDLLAGNPSWLGMPGAGVISGFTILIAAYIPAGILIGATAGWLDGFKLDAALRPIFHKLFPVAAAILLVGIGGWEARHRLNDLQPSKNALVTRPDVNAAGWIRDNTAPDSRFMVNSFFAYSNSTIVGSDGGWWLPLLARRRNTVPPINYTSERNTQSDYVDQTNSLISETQSNGIQDPDVLFELRKRNISYVYIGQQQGQVNWGEPLFTAAQMLADKNFLLVYHQDRVWIFEILKGSS